jgi:glutathione S-transferase
MKLLYSEYSPFARKVRMVALHHGIGLELIPTVTADRDEALMTANPLGKIPVLLLENNHTLIDSPAIAAFLDAAGHEEKLLPADLLQRAQIMHLEALADGILDAAVLCVMETRRPEEKRWQGQWEKQLDNIRRTLLHLEQHADFFALPLSVAHLSAGAAFDYLRHRLPMFGFSEDWLANTPQLAAWYEHFLHHPLMQQTCPIGGWS